MSRADLEREFEARKRALIEARDELDRRDRDKVGGGRGVDVDFTKYGGDGIEQ